MIFFLLYLFLGLVVTVWQCWTVRDGFSLQRLNLGAALLMLLGFLSSILLWPIIVVAVIIGGEGDGE